MLLILILFLAFSHAEHQTLCTSDACFTLHLNEVSFNQAHENCFDNGGYLMTITNKEEDDTLRTLLSQTAQQEKPLKVRIGLKLRRESCVISNMPLKGFQWVSDEEDSQYSNWGREPQNTCHERCVSVVYHPMGHNHMKWIDVSCNKHSPYVCKFYFKGMCNALTLLGPGQIAYTAPFSKVSQHYQMKALPVGTFADITCSNQEPLFTWCEKTQGDVHAWSNPGPFCQTNRSCSVKNGGCEHMCNVEGNEVICSCDGGYELNKDGFSCRLKNMCFQDTCQYQCVMGERGFLCLCPPGLQLDFDQRTCMDIDECLRADVCGEHLCINTEGSYACNCKEGFEMIDGECRDLDECISSTCEHACLNSYGSFSCQCKNGFELAEDLRSCEDIDECLVGRCKFECVNTKGSFLCACPIGFQLDRTGECFPNVLPSESLPESPSEVLEVRENFTESFSSTVELQHESPHTNAPRPEFNITVGHERVDTSLASSPSKSNNYRVIVCVLGSVIPLVVLMGITLGILMYSCNQVKKEDKKNTTADGYCWVSSGLDPRLEKLYESIPTDDV